MTGRRLTFLQACAELGFGVEDMHAVGDNSSSASDGENEEIFENDENSYDDEDREEQSVVDDEGDISIYEESSENDDSEENEFENENILANGIHYTMQPLAVRRRRRNILTPCPRTLANPVNEKEAFHLFMHEDILRTILRYTNMKARQVRRSLRRPDNYSLPFSMKELLAGLAIIVRAGSDRDNFTELENLWSEEDGKPFYRACMAIRRFKYLIRCLRFDNSNTREVRKEENKFAAVSEIWELFLSSLRRYLQCDENITIDEQLVGYRGRIPGRTYMPSKPRKYGLKIFWACESSSGYALNGLIYGGRNPNEGVQ